MLWSFSGSLCSDLRVFYLWQQQRQSVCPPCVFSFDYFHMRTCSFHTFTSRPYVLVQCLSVNITNCNKSSVKAALSYWWKWSFDYFPAVWFEESLSVKEFQSFPQRTRCCQSWRELCNIIMKINEVMSPRRSAQSRLNLLQHAVKLLFPLVLLNTVLWGLG